MPETRNISVNMHHFVYVSAVVDNQNKHVGKAILGAGVVWELLNNKKYSTEENTEDLRYTHCKEAGNWSKYPSNLSIIEPVQCHESESPSKRRVRKQISSNV